MANAIWSLLARSAERDPDAVALVDARGRRTWSEAARDAARLAALLREVGVERGDRVALLDENTPEVLVATFAAAALGAILQPLNPRLAPPELAAILLDAEPRWVLARPALAEVLAGGLAALGGGRGSPEGVLWLDGGARGGPALPPRVRELELAAAAALDASGLVPADAGPSVPAQLYHTSGSTGRPKGVVLTHGNLASHAEHACRELALDAREVWGHFAPMFHLADAWATLAVTRAGGRHAFVRRFDAGRVLDCIARERVTLTNLVPTMLVRLTAEQERAPRDLASLRLCLSGGAPIAPALVARVLDALGCEYAQTYGLTETSPFLTLGLLPEHLRTGPQADVLAWRAKTGRPFAAVELEVVDERGRVVAPDGRQVGEIRARGETVTPGYWRRPDATAEALRDGWFYTGDLAVVDEEGFVTIVDRAKDVILTGGETVYSIEVEQALSAHGAVAECAAFGLPDAEWGERVCAAVVLRPGARAAAAELVRSARTRLAGYKLPRELFLVDELPRTGSGKVHKPTLRSRFGGGEAART